MEEKSARLIKRATSDGLVEMRDNVKLGKVYTVYHSSTRVLKFYNYKKKEEHEKECIEALCPDGAKELIPTELLEIIED